jgi:HemK-related putative methylase
MHELVADPGNSLIEPAPRGLARTALGRLANAWYRLAGLDAYDDFRLEQVAGLRILVLPSVANPKLLRTGAFFASRIDATMIRAGSSVLDMGTGSGICALLAAQQARRVVGVDINPAAVRCARINAAINRLESRAEFRHGDLFAPVQGERFDCVLFNPPFLLGTPRDARDAAWRSEDGALRFAAGLRDHLLPGGTAFVLLSSFGDACASYETQLRRHGFALSVHATHRYLSEALTLLRAVAHDPP